jgi:hypothetical protein
MAMAFRGPSRRPTSSMPLDFAALGYQRDPAAVLDPPAMGADVAPGMDMAPAGMAPAPMQRPPMPDMDPAQSMATRSAAVPGMFGRTSEALSRFSAPKIKPHFFDKSGVGGKILHGLGEAALRYSAMEGSPGAMMVLRQRQQTADDAREEARWQRQHDVQRADILADREAQQNQPQFFSGAEDRLRYDPTTGQTTTLYDAPTPAQEYAQGMGYDPDTADYRTAMQDYTLKGYGATAMQARMAQDAQRTQDRLSVRSAPTYRDTHARPAAPVRPRAQASYAPPRTTNAVIAPILAKMARGEPLTGNEQAALDYNRRGSGGGRAPIGGAAGGGAGGGSPRTASPPTATDPRTGRKIQFVNGAWAPAR